MLPQTKSSDLLISCRNISKYCLQFTVSKWLTTKDFSVFSVFYFPVIRQRTQAKPGCSTLLYHCPQCLELGSGQAQRKYNKAFMMMCVINQKGGGEGSAGKLWVSSQTHLSTPLSLPNAHKFNCVVSQRRWTLSRDVKGGTKGRYLGQSSKCLFAYGLSYNIHQWFPAPSAHNLALPLMHP